MNSSPQPRGHWEGLIKVFRFNWPLFAWAGAVVILSAVLAAMPELPLWLRWFCGVLAFGAAAQAIVSLVVTHVAYDLGGLYDFAWLQKLAPQKLGTVLHISTGFDETSERVARVLQPRRMICADIFDPAKHTEVSIVRARRLHPPAEHVRQIGMQDFGINSDSVDLLLALFSAHEIRSNADKIAFFREAARVLRADGRMLMLEHLRDVPNLLAYGAGILHFASRMTWRTTSASGGLTVTGEHAVNHWMHCFILQKENEMP